jgi:sec-independent protein translocase protein TatB
MFNVGSGEFLVIFLLALIVLGPDKLPETARKVGKVIGDLRQMSSGFQQEMREAMDVDSIKQALNPTSMMSQSDAPTLPPLADDTPKPSPAPTEIVASTPEPIETASPATEPTDIGVAANPTTPAPRPQTNGQQGAA